MQFPIIIYWAINILLFAFMYGSKPITPAIIWMTVMMLIWIFEVFKYYNFLQKNYPEEYSQLVNKKTTLKKHLKFYVATDDNDLKANQKRFKQILISIPIWFVLAPTVSIIGAIIRLK